MPGGTGGKGGKPLDNDGFAARLSAHLDSGTRPGLKPGAVGGKWTAPAFGKAVGVSQRTVRNWRNGSTLPEAENIPFLLDALFGDEPGPAGERTALHEAWDAAHWSRTRDTLAAATPEPDGTVFTEQEGRLVPAPAPASDHAAAALPAVVNRHPILLEKLDDLLDAIGTRLDNQPSWRALPRMAQRLRAALDRPPAELPDRLDELYDRTASLASFVELDDRLGQDPNAAANPLDADLRRPLADALASLAPWLRSFPSVLAWDSARADMLTRQDLFATLRPRLADARALIQAAETSGVLSAEDAARVMTPLDTAEREGFQAEKAGYRGVATARNLLVATGLSVASFYAGAVASDFATKSALVPSAGSMLAQAEAAALRLASDLPADLAEATRYILRHRESFVLKALTPLTELPTMPPSPTLRRDPATGFDPEQVKRLVLAGEAPPPEWVPFITDLNLSGETAFSDLRPLIGLTSLRGLSLDQTAVTDLQLIAGLTSLNALGLNETSVTDLQPIAGLAKLQRLSFDETIVTNIKPLTGLLNLEVLSLRGTVPSDLKPLAGLTGLRELYLDNVGMTDLRPLARLRNLEVLSLNEVSLWDLRPLSGLKKLRELSLNTVGLIADLKPLANLTNLEELSLGGRMTDYSQLTGLTKLTVRYGRQTFRPAFGEIGWPCDY